jgi:hypothetical protein
MPSRFFAAGSDALFAETGSTNVSGQFGSKGSAKTGSSSGRLNVGIATGRFLMALMSDGEEQDERVSKSKRPRRKSMAEAELAENTQHNQATGSGKLVGMRSLNQLSATLGEGGRFTRAARGIFGSSWGLRRRMAAMKDDFMKEMRLLSRLRHPNIVTVMVCCLD